MTEEEQPTEWAMDVFRPFVESTLDEWKQDVLFRKFGLRSTDTILAEGGDAPTRSMHPYNLIVREIGNKISKAYKLKKEKRTIMTSILRNKKKELKAMIWARQNQGHARRREIAAPRQTLVTENELIIQESTFQQHREIETLSQYHEIDVDLSPKQLQMKEEFEKKKKEVLDSLPEEAKARFGQQYFSKWGKNQLPVLVLSPYIVPPGDIRNMWFAMYEKCKQQGRLESLPNLIYWYGSYDEPKNGYQYSFVVTESLLPYENGVKKNMNKVPITVKKKLDTGKKLTSLEKMQVEGLVEMEEDRSKEPEERHGRMVQAFLEDWETTEEEPEVVVLDKELPTEPSKPVANSSNKFVNSRKRDARQVSGRDDETAPSEKKSRSSVEVAVAANPSPNSIRANDNVSETPFDKAMAAITKLNDRLEQSEKELENSKQQVRRLKSQMESNNKEIGNLKAQYESLEEEMEQMKMNHALELGFAQGA